MDWQRRTCRRRALVVSARRPAPLTRHATRPQPKTYTNHHHATRNNDNTNNPQTEVLPPVQIGSPPADFPFKLAGFTDVSPEEFVYARTPGGNWIAAATDPSGRLYMIDEVRRRGRGEEGRRQGGVRG